MIDMIEDVRATDAADRFVWVRTQDLPEEDHAELFCGPAAAEAARRAAATFPRSDVACDAASCTFAHEGGNATPYLFGAPNAEGTGALLIGFWDGLAGDVRRERLERWREELACGERVAVSAGGSDEE